MADTNDIDALLDLLAAQSRFGFHSALTALVAERNALREQLRLANIDQFNTEAEANDRDRELRERMVDSALRGVGALSMLNEETAKFVGRQAVWMVDGALAAMRKGEQDGK